MSATESTPEQRELSLVGKVEMRIALADTDSKLTAILKTYLAPLLLKLASDHQSVRNKVISICQHLSARVQPESIQLPVAGLIKQFKEQQSSLIRHFDFVYIQQGVGRLSSAERAELLPMIIQGYAGTGQQEAQVFNLLLRLLDSFRIPSRGSKEDVEMRAALAVSDEDIKLLVSRLGKFLLFSPQKNDSRACPGVRPDEYDLFTLSGKQDVWNSSAGGLNLLRTKTLAARLLATGLFTDLERFLPALFASADPASSISEVGDDMLKRATPAMNLDDEQFVVDLFGLYFGRGNIPRVRPPLRLKILSLLNKSTKSTTFATNITKLVEDGVAPQQQDGEDVVMSGVAINSTNTGREATKLRAAIFSYINFVARHGDKDTLHTIAPQVVNQLRDFIENQGWPKPGSSEDLVSRAYAYEVIGLLAKAGPRSLLVEEDMPSLDLLRWLFDSLARDSSGNAITISIEESLSTVLNAASRLSIDRDEQSALEDLLIHQITQSGDLQGNKLLRSTRYVAVRFANRCLPYSSVKARWIDVLCMGATSDRPEVREEAERGLSPYWHRMLNGSVTSADEVALEFPGFQEVVEQFITLKGKVTGTDPTAIVRHSREQHQASFPHMTTYARRMLIQHALSRAEVPANIDSEWERTLDALTEADLPARAAVRSYIEAETHDSSSKFDILLCALFECLSSSADSKDHLVVLLALCPDALIQSHVHRARTLLPSLRSTHHGRRTAAAHAFGILASHPTSHSASDIDDLLGIVRQWSSAVGAGLSSVHGAVLALGFCFSRLACRTGCSPETNAYRDFLQILFEIFRDARDDLVRESSYVAIGQMCMFSCLSASAVDQHCKLQTVIDKLYEKAKDGNEPAILCLGQLSMVLPEDGTELISVEEQLHKLHEIRQSEVHFTVGESLSYLAAGWQSTALATNLDVDRQTEVPLSQRRETTLPKLVDRILADCNNTKPALKKAAVMWLLCLVQFCGAQLQSRLSECQAAFRRCLSDRDELVQETASRGLGLVYEKGDRAVKDDLVRELVSSFSSDKQQLAGNVSADTQLFEPGALPTGDGSVSTYKDIMSLASEVGDSSLVYKFMSMASSNAIWSSRAAFGRFGLSRVLSDASVDGYLANNPKLYPKLFRYRFDPNGGVQRSMNDIWNALVPDSAATIDKHFDAIMEDLLSSILGKEWRVRQACCAAIADLVQGRALEKYEGYLERIWTQCFKVLDDIKESVRAAAGSLARTMTGVLTRALEADHSSTKNASAMLKHVLPFLLSPSGMESSAKEVQMFSVQTLLEIIKKANGATIRPFLPELVERLIGLLSSLEPEAVNYLHLNASKYNLTEQKIDDMRLSSIRSSPIMEAIERCLDLLDDATMAALWPKLESAMKGAVGLPSKVGSSRVLVSLATRRMVLFRPMTDDALRLIEKLVIDRNETVSSSYAVAAGYLARGASDKQILRLIKFAQKLYFESEGDRESSVPRRSITSGEIMYAFAKHASDKFSHSATAALPFVFVGKHDSNDQVKEQFQETWNEAVGGSRAVQLYLKEILELCTTHLDSPQWTLKHTAARTVAEVVFAVATSEAQMSSTTANTIWPALDRALGGKTWEGKEEVLYAFAKFIEIGKPFYLQDEKVRASIVKLAIREAKRQNATYRQHSLKALGRVARARTDIDMNGAVVDVVEPLLTAHADVDAMDVDESKDSARKTEDLKEATLAAAIDALFSSINPTISDASVLAQQLSHAIHLVAQANNVSVVFLRSTYEALSEMFKRVRKAERSIELPPAAAQDLRKLLFGPVVGIEAVRLIRADAIVAAVRASPSLATALESEIRAAVKEEVSQSVRQRLAAALKTE